MNWIKTSEQKPEHGQPCLVVYPGGNRPWMATYFTNDWLTTAGYRIDPLKDPEPEYWAALPDIPGKVE